MMEAPERQWLLSKDALWNSEDITGGDDHRQAKSGRTESCIGQTDGQENLTGGK